MHADLAKLWRLADTAPRARGQSADASFESIGLLLSRHLEHGGYGDPENLRMFAGTGGDGVHFSFVVGADRVVRDHSPVVMSVPANDGAYSFVGETLREFLALGTRFGFFFLERLTYDREDFLARYSGARESWALGTEAKQRLHLLAETFEIEPWPRPRARLDELEALRTLLEAPRPVAQHAPPNPTAFWEGILAIERARPERDRDETRIATIEDKLRALRNTEFKS